MSKYKIVKDINPNIFRGYDIRAIYGQDLNEDIAYTIGLAFGSYVKSKGYDKCLVGHDVRTSSKPLNKAMITGITNSGLNVVSLGLVTTPMYYFAQKHLGIDPGVMITASHNPKEYNGFKIAFDDFGNACGEMIQDFRRFVEKCEFSTGEGTVEKVDVKKDYLELIKNSIELGSRKIKAVVDAGNGTASIIIKEVFDMFDNIECGIIDEKGNMVYTDFYAIIIWRDLMSKVSNKNALFDVKCSKSLSDEIIKLGGHPVCYRTGNSYMKAKMKRENFVFGNELSGHVWFNDKWPNIDDGIYAGLRLIEILSKTDKSITGLLEGITRYYSTPEILIKSTDDDKFKVIEKVKSYCRSQEYNINDIDGVRAEFNNGWALVRASNTSPNITARFEGRTKEDMEKIQREFMSLLK